MLARVNKLLVSAVLLLKLVQIIGVTGGGGHVLKFLSQWVVPPAA